MIVNPQLFNYRLIIGSLLVVLAALGVFSFTNYKSIKSYQDFLEQEKLLIENELSEMLNDYDNLSEDYDFLAAELQKAKLETKLALDSLRLLKSDLSIITKFKEQLVIFKSKNRLLTGTIDSLNNANLQLQKEKRFALKTISKKSDTITELESVNANLNKTIDNAAVLKASLVNAQSYKLKSGKKRYTSRARRADAIDVCISLNENPLTKRGEKEIYIQIVDPDNNVVADKGEISFGETTLIYSQKKRILYKNENLEFCVPIVAAIEDKPLLKGSYFINVFHENRKLGSTSIELK